MGWLKLLGVYGLGVVTGVIGVYIFLVMEFRNMRW